MSERQEDRLDARLRSELRSARPEPPLEEVDWAALRERIAQRAEPALARLRRGAAARRATWWDYAARWAGPALPAALVAAAALTLLLGRLVSVPGATGTQGEAAATRLTLESALGAAPSDTETTMLYASADRDALLRAAVGDDR